MIPGLALLWAVGLGDTATNLPRLRLSFQGRCTWQMDGPTEVNRKDLLVPVCACPHQTLAGLGAFLGHLQLILP